MVAIGFVLSGHVSLWTHKAVAYGSEPCEREKAAPGLGCQPAAALGPWELSGSHLADRDSFLQTYSNIRYVHSLGVNFVWNSCLQSETSNRI